MNIKAIWLSLAMWSISCSVFAQDQTYILMDDELSELRTDFNDAVDQVRLVFIVGPT